MPELRVLVVGDDPLARSGLAGILSAQDGLRVVGHGSTRDGLAASLSGAAPQVALWDLGLQGAGASELRAMEGVVVPVLALVRDAEDAAEALAAGARGVLFREADPNRLRDALAAVAGGLLVLDPELAGSLLRAAAPPSDLVEPLTPREMQVLQLLAQGLSNRLVAERLGISEHTAKFHVNAILGKLGAGSRTEAIVLAARHGLIAL